MHTYSPTASHDAVVEFDNGDIGNQTNLNNAVRALGNRTELAKVTNDSQASAIATLQSQMALAYFPAVLMATPTINAMADGGAWASNEDMLEYSSFYFAGNDVASGLALTTFTGTGGGTKLIRLGAGMRYQINIALTLGTSASTMPFNPPEWMTLGVQTATNTAFSSGISSAGGMGTIVAHPHVNDNGAFPDLIRYLCVAQGIIANTSGAPLYMRIRLLTPLDTDSTITISDGSVIVRQIGPVSL